MQRMELYSLGILTEHCFALCAYVFGSGKPSHLPHLLGSCIELWALRSPVHFYIVKTYNQEA